MSTLLLAIGFGLVTSAVIALSAVALSLQFSISNIPNFAHGEFLTLGAYGAFVAQVFTHNLVIDAIGAVVFAAAAGWLVNTAVIEPFVRRGAKITFLFVLTIAVSLILQNGLIMVFGGTTQTLVLTPQNFIQVGPFHWTPVDLAVMVTALAIMVALHFVLRYTTFGKAQRAVADNRELAAVSGIDTARIVHLTWLLAGGIAGVAGFVIAMSGGTFNPTTGYSYLLVTFAAAVIGGLGRPYGAMLGALVIGIATEISGAFLNASYKQVIAIALLVVVLLLRPAGLFTPKSEVAA